MGFVFYFPFFQSNKVLRGAYPESVDMEEYTQNEEGSSKLSSAVIDLDDEPGPSNRPLKEKSRCCRPHRIAPSTIKPQKVNLSNCF